MSAVMPVGVSPGDGYGVAAPSVASAVASAVAASVASAVAASVASAVAASVGSSVTVGSPVTAVVGTAGVVGLAAGAAVQAPNTRIATTPSVNRDNHLGRRDILGTSSSLRPCAAGPAAPRHPREPGSQDDMPLPGP